MKDKTPFLAWAAVCLALYVLIGCAIYYLHSGWPLFAVFLTPGLETQPDGVKKKPKIEVR